MLCTASSDGRNMVPCNGVPRLRVQAQESLHRSRLLEIGSSDDRPPSSCAIAGTRLKASGSCMAIADAHLALVFALLYIINHFVLISASRCLVLSLLVHCCQSSNCWKASGAESGFLKVTVWAGEGPSLVQTSGAVWVTESSAACRSFCTGL